MASYPTNHKLPFDVLGVIFAHYADEETIYAPLETFLLVSRSWSEAALGHRAVWGNLKIHISHGKSSEQWNVRLPLRLERCSLETPLDISIRTFLDETNPSASYRTAEDALNPDLYLSCPVLNNLGKCRCFADAVACFEISLRRLAGENGERCIHWRSLILLLNDNESRSVAMALSYPTPNLTYLSLTSVNIWCRDIQLFPSTPKVKQITLLECRLCTPLDFENVVNATVGWKRWQLGHQGLEKLRDATKLRELSIVTSAVSPIPLPARMHKLRVLRISGVYFPLGIYECEIPQLSCLTIDLHGGGVTSHLWMEKLLRSKGPNLSELRRITLMSNNMRRYKFTESSLVVPICELLKRARKLEHIATDGTMLSVIIRCTWWSRSRVDHGLLSWVDDSVYDLLGGAYLVNLDRGETVNISGMEPREFFEEIARNWDCIPPDVNADDFMNLLHVN